MAKLYPESISSNPDIADSEKQLFEKLRSLDDSYHIFHSVTWNDGRDGECDFIIFHELKGFIALEVKGGVIDFDGRTWQSTDSKGIVHKIKNPAEQARNSMYAIKAFYEKKFTAPMPGIYLWGVCFFDGNWNKACNTLDLSEANVFDMSGLENPASRVENMFSENESRHGIKILSAKEKANLLSIFNHSLHLPMSLNRIIAEQQKHLASTDMIQDYILDLFEDKNRIAFQGAAGTGKTWIAMKKAVRLSDEGKRVLFLCYNKHVNDFVRDWLEEKENIEVMTFHSFALSVVRDFITGEIEAAGSNDQFFKFIDELIAIGIDGEPQIEKKETGKALSSKVNGAINSFRNFNSGVDYQSVIRAHKDSIPSLLVDIVSLLLPGDKPADDYYSERLPLAVTSAFESGSSHLEEYTYDAVIVDEGQDFHKNWCDTLKFIFDKYRSRVVYLFYDDNQTIFTKQKNLPITGLIVESGLGNHLFRLRDNLRNTQEIHNFAVEKSGLGGTSRSADINGITPSEKSFKNGKSASAYIASLLEDLISKHGIEQEKVVLLSNRNIENSIFSDDNKAGNFTLVSTGAGKRNNSVRFRTIHRFKGLESDVVILLLHRRPADLEESERYLSSELLYVGFSRAKHLLYVVNVEFS